MFPKISYTSTEDTNTMKELSQVTEWTLKCDLPFCCHSVMSITYGTNDLSRAMNLLHETITAINWMGH
jgi:hypothetical protein